jgi:Mn-dependent DtxR family transcriptional regulator
MTPQQSACLRAIAHHWRAYGESPTRTELGRDLGCCKVSAHQMLKRLQNMGMVELHPRIWRNIELTQAGAALA